jgi:hypothetical protein
MNAKHLNDYDDAITARCERALITLLGDLGLWRERMYLVGGLAPRYLVGELPSGVAAHVGTTDVDLVIGLALGDEAPETYRTLQNNLNKSGFTRSSPSFRWRRDVDGMSVLIEFLCETSEVEPGSIYSPKGEGLGTKVAAFNVKGAQLASQDFIECELEGERLDGGGLSRVSVRVANILPYTILKVFAFQDRHENKDSYDLVFTLLNHEGGPKAAGQKARESPIIEHQHSIEALALLADRYATINHDGPVAHAAFLADPATPDQDAQLRQQAVAVVREFLAVATAQNDQQ